MNTRNEQDPLIISSNTANSNDFCSGFLDTLSGVAGFITVGSILTGTGGGMASGAYGAYAIYGCTTSGLAVGSLMCLGGGIVGGLASALVIALPCGLCVTITNDCLKNNSSQQMFPFWKSATNAIEPMKKEETYTSIASYR